MFAPWKRSYDKLRQCIKKQRHHFADKGPYSQSYGFSVVMCGCGGRRLSTKNWYFLIVVLEKSLESPLDWKEMKPVNLKGNQPWIFIGRTDDEAETPILWPPSVKSQVTGKDPKAGEARRQKEKGVVEDEIASATQWTWIWANSRRQWRTGEPGILQSTGSQRVGPHLATEQQQQKSSHYRLHFNSKVPGVPAFPASVREGSWVIRGPLPGPQRTSFLRIKCCPQECSLVRKLQQIHFPGR